MVLTIITGNVKRKVREKKPSCRKGCRTWNKIDFEYNRILQIERKLPASHSYLINKLIHRIRDLCPSMLHKFNQGEIVEVHLKLVTAKGHQRRVACQQSLRGKVIKSGKVCNLFLIVLFFLLSISGGVLYIGPVLLSVISCSVIILGIHIGWS